MYYACKHARLFASSRGMGACRHVGAALAAEQACCRTGLPVKQGDLDVAHSVDHRANSREGEEVPRGVDEDAAMRIAWFVCREGSYDRRQQSNNSNRKEA